MSRPNTVGGVDQHVHEKRLVQDHALPFNYEVYSIALVQVRVLVLVVLVAWRGTIQSIESDSRSRNQGGGHVGI